MCVPGCQETVRHALTRRGFFKGAAAGFAATAVVPTASEAAPRKFKSVVDLTHTMLPDCPTFFGVPGIEMEKKFDFKKDGFNLYWWRIIEHAGTHLDAPIHFSEAGITAEKIAAPTLVIHGQSDQLVPAGNGELIASRVPGAKLVMLPHASHIFTTDQPEASQRAIMDFLGRQAPSP
jgi:pimeloyl-ACP methyl ester carboxylesterase